MAGSSAGAAGGGSESGQPLSEINVTPFVDVVLVLLVVLMVTAPALVRESIALKLPKAKTGSSDVTPRQLGIAVNRVGQILVEGVPLDDAAIVERVRSQLQADPELLVLIGADGDARHSEVVRAIDLARQAGAVRFAVQVERPASDRGGQAVPRGSGN